MASSTPYDDEQHLGKAYDARLMRRLLAYLRPYRLQMAAALVLLAVLVLLELAGPLLIKIAIDQHISQGDVGGLDLVAGAYLAMLVALFAVRYSQTYLLNSAGQRAMHDLRVQTFSHLQHQSLAFFDRNAVGRLMTRVTNDVEALNEMLTSGVLSIFSDVITLAGIAIVLTLLNWKLALLTFVIMPVLLWATNQLRIRLRESFRAVRIRLARLNAYLAENVSGMQTVQLFNREARNFAAFDDLNRDYLNVNLRAVVYHALFSPLVSVTLAVALALIVWYGGAQVLEGALTLGALVAFIQYVERFFHPIRDLSEKYTIMQAAMASSERIFQLLDQQTSLADPAEPRELGRVKGAIEFRKVWFAYDQDTWVLKDLNLSIAPGERVAVVGATGAGKTSLINLLCRFYDPQQGQVLIDGVDVREVRQRELRRHIGLVLQDPFLFAGTIERNIRLQEPSISDEAVRRAAQYVNAHTFIERLPGGYREEVKERGAGLSVGQKQLIAFARAIAINPEILLVLDEATSSVDTETEALVQEGLRRLMQGRTSIVIAHRLSTIRDVDRIVVLHKGRVVESGTHAELLADNRVYARLYELQYQGQGLQDDRPQTPDGGRRTIPATSVRER